MAARLVTGIIIVTTLYALLQFGLLLIRHLPYIIMMTSASLAMARILVGLLSRSIKHNTTKLSCVGLCHIVTPLSYRLNSIIARCLPVYDTLRTLSERRDMKTTGYCYEQRETRKANMAICYVDNIDKIRR